MGVLTDYVVARADEAAQVASCDLERSTWPREDLKGFDVIPLTALWSVLSGTDYDALELPRCLAEVSDEGPWVYQIAPPLVALIAGMSDADLPRIADAWRQIEELDGLDAANAQDVLEVLRGLARRAQADGVDLLMWMSL
jgi:hypothetical protein